MVWHIFKKDWKLMWRPAAAVATLELAYAFIRLESEFDQGNPVLQQFSTLLTMLWVVASVILVVMLVHQDALPGTKQDWLTRPIRRGDVMIAKLNTTTPNTESCDVPMAGTRALSSPRVINIPHHVINITTMDSSAPFCTHTLSSRSANDSGMTSKAVIQKPSEMR